VRRSGVALETKKPRISLKGFFCINQAWFLHHRFLFCFEASDFLDL
jgi:hypothetical protein